MFGSGKPINTEQLGFFLAPTFGITQMDGSTAALFNLRGDLGLRDKWSFEAYFSTSLNDITPQS